MANPTRSISFPIPARCIACALALAASVGCKGSTGPAGSAGDAGAPGEADTTGTVSVKVSVAPTTGPSVPLAGVTVLAETTSGGAIATDGSDHLIVTATTDATGAAALTLPLGVFDLTFTKAGYTSPDPVQVGVSLAGVAVAVTLAEAATSQPTITLVSAANEIGYGRTTALTASATSPRGAALTYVWTNTSTYGLGSVLATAPGAATATLTTPTLAQANAPAGSIAAGNWTSGYTIPNTFGVFPIMEDTQGNTIATVTVGDGFGQSSSASVTISAAAYQGAEHATAVGTRIYLNSGQGSGADAGPTLSSPWTLTTPAGSTSTLDNPNAQYPSFNPDVFGAYVATLGTNSITIYAGSWVGAIKKGVTTATNTNWVGSGPGSVPFGFNNECTVCHTPGDVTGPGSLGGAIDEFTPWAGTKHAVMMTYGMDGVPGFASGESCLACHSVGFDPANKNSLAGGLSQVAAAQTPPWTYPATIAPGNWAAVPAPVQQLSNIQCESCHGPQGGGAAGDLSSGHKLTDVMGVTEPFQSPRISYASESCGVCHAENTTHHEYSEWATLNPDTQQGHSNLALAQSDGLQAVDGGPGIVLQQINSSCGRCHTAQGYTEYVDNILAGNVGSLNPAQQAAGQITVNNVQPQTCAACHDPHANATDPVTGEDEYQLRVWNNLPLLPSGFAANGLGAGAVCETCHNSRNGAYNANAASGATTTAYLHEDSDPIGSNPGASNTVLAAKNYAGLGTKFTSLGGPHEANQGDVFEGHNAYFLNNATPVLSPHAAVKDTCVGCHMTNNPATYLSHGAATSAGHLFAITNADVPLLCSKCHGNGSTSVDGQSLQASVKAGLNTVVNNMSAAALARINDSSGTYTIPNSTTVKGYGTWTDTGTITIAAKALTDTTPGCTPATGSSCGLTNTTAITIVTGPSTANGYNPAISAVVSPQGRSGINVVLTFTNAVPITFTGGVVNNNLTSFTVNLAATGDGAGTVGASPTAAVINPLFSSNGNMFKANWNWSLISQDDSLGVHNPPFVSEVLSATAAPFGNPNATPPQPGGLWY